MRSTYDGKWRAFEDWCVKTGVVAFQSPVPAILTFLQELLDKGLAFFTVKVYLAAISACHMTKRWVSIPSAPSTSVKELGCPVGSVAPAL